MALLAALIDVQRAPPLRRHDQGRLR